MPKIKNNQNKKTGQDRIIYALIFFVYGVLVILLFVYSIKFLGQTLNSAFSQPQGAELEAKYGQLQLDNYAVVAKKLGLSAPVKKEGANQEAPAPVEQSTSTPEIATSTEATINPETTANTETTTDTGAPIEMNSNNSTSLDANLEVKPIIAVINSTLTAGLAAGMQADLQAAGLEVQSVGNSKPVLENTVIKVKVEFNPNSSYLAEIKKIVSQKYDFTIEPLNYTSSNDIEIIIGNK